MLKKGLYLDDERNPKTMCYDWHIVRNFYEFTTYIQLHGMPDHISFDHDLGEERTGKDCANWLVEYCMNLNINLPSFNVHSANTCGRDNIEKLLLNFKNFQDDRNIC